MCLTSLSSRLQSAMTCTSAHKQSRLSAAVFHKRCHWARLQAGTCKSCGVGVVSSTSSLTPAGCASFNSSLCANLNISSTRSCRSPVSRHPPVSSCGNAPAMAPQAANCWHCHEKCWDSKLRQAKNANSQVAGLPAHPISTHPGEPSPSGSLKAMPQSAAAAAQARHSEGTVLLGSLLQTLKDLQAWQAAKLHPHALCDPPYQGEVWSHQTVILANSQHTPKQLCRYTSNPSCNVKDGSKRDGLCRILHDQPAPSKTDAHPRNVCHEARPIRPTNKPERHLGLLAPTLA